LLSLEAAPGLHKLNLNSAVNLIGNSIKSNMDVTKRFIVTSLMVDLSLQIHVWP
jgi:hypothetical protein